MTAVLEVQDLRHEYGNTEALTGVNLSVADGEIVALLGPNGAGKTTLVRSVIGLIKPSSGTVVVAGADPSKAVVRQQVGVVQQDVGFPRTLTVSEVVEGAAARAGADHAAAERAMIELGLDSLRKRRGSDLSGGQQQRLQLAMGLVADPVLLVLDEPTVGLDVSARRAFWATMAERRRGGTGILLTTHIVEEAAEVADRVVVLDRGVIVAEGTPNDLKRTIPGRRITANTIVSAETVRAADGVVNVSRRGKELAITAIEAEPVVRLLLGLDDNLHDLVVTTPSLDEVMIDLVTKQEEVAA